MVEVKFACHPDSVKERPFIPELYLRRTDDGIEIGLSNRRGYDYAWAIIPKAELDAALALLNVKD